MPERQDFPMKASLIDRGKYYRGLLVLIARDRIIDQREHSLMLQIGKMLDFDLRFCETTIADLLKNRHITNEPILFDDTEIARCFISDALKLALIDEEIHSNELAWLKTVAQANRLADEWFDKEYQRLHKEVSTEIQPDSFEIHPYI